MRANSAGALEAEQLNRVLAQILFLLLLPFFLLLFLLLLFCFILSS